MALTKRQADPFCAKTPMKEEEVVVGPGGGLKNVVVRVTKGVSGQLRAARRRRDRRPERLHVPPARAGHRARPAGADQEQRPDAAQHPRLQGRVDAVQPGGDPGPAADDPAVHRRRPDREAEVRRAPVDDRVRAGVQPSVLRGHRRRRQLQDHGPAARQLHGRGLARTLRRKNCGDHRRRRQARRSCVRSSKRNDAADSRRARPLFGYKRARCCSTPASSTALRSRPRSPHIC